MLMVVWLLKEIAQTNQKAAMAELLPDVGDAVWCVIEPAMQQRVTNCAL